MRTKLNIILGCCLSEVLREMGYSDNNLVSGPPDVVPLTLQRGMYLEYEVTYEKWKRILQVAAITRSGMETQNAASAVTWT